MVIDIHLFLSIRSLSTHFNQCVFLLVFRIGGSPYTRRTYDDLRRRAAGDTADLGSSSEMIRSLGQSGGPQSVR